MNGQRCEHGAFQLLPGTDAEGKPGYVLGDGSGPASRMAERIARIRLDMAGELLDHAAELLPDRRITWVELHFLASRLSESLREVLRVAECHGAAPHRADVTLEPGLPAEEEDE